MRCLMEEEVNGLWLSLWEIESRLVNYVVALLELPKFSPE